MSTREAFEKAMVENKVHPNRWDSAWEGWCAALESQPEPVALTDEQIVALLPGSYYMDPPDGGDVSLYEQFRRMSEDAARWRRAVEAGRAPGERSQ